MINTQYFPKLSYIPFLIMHVHTQTCEFKLYIFNFLKTTIKYTIYE